MIQRIQTVWLALAAFCLGGLFLVPQMAVTVTPFAAETGQIGNIFSFLNSWEAMVLASLAAVLAILGIFLFKKRLTQIHLTRLALIDTLLMIVVVGVQFYIESARTISREIQIGWAVALPVLAVIFLWLALRAIRKDENLVKSMNRLR